ncbi:MAG: Spy/CpxP family protein refolding chaperone [Acidobacteriaceae bacterium]|nr:Spy/CpxP family protein refolding chaperone [Acidobacteriaceae bacterium]
MLNPFRWGSTLLLMAAALQAQQPQPPPYAPHHPPRADHLLRPFPPGTFWNDPGVVARLDITPDQQKRMEALFQQNRPKLMTLSSSLEMQEAPLHQLLEADHPDEPRVLAQIDKIAQARADLEKANARFLLGLRNILTPDQWHKLEFEHGPPPGPPQPAGHDGHPPDNPLSL